MRAKMGNSQRAKQFMPFAALQGFEEMIRDDGPASVSGRQGTERIYLVVDLKSFYASVECVERGLDPMKVNLVVADPDRTDRTICLAITPAMKALGVKNRCRVFEIPPDVDYIMATPRMALYMAYSARIYEVYRKHVAPEDIHVYSVDEAFLDVTDYLQPRRLTARGFAECIMEDIYQTTGILSACGIGTNMYPAKVALDILAKHQPDRIAVLTEQDYQKQLWDHQPLTDFWRIGPGTRRRLDKIGLTTMRKIAEADPDVLYRLFGIDAELLIDHAWGRETAGIPDIRSYRPKNHSLSSGQVLGVPRDRPGGRLIAVEMTDVLSLDLVRHGWVTDSVTMYISYSIQGWQRGTAGGTLSVGGQTSSASRLMKCAGCLYDRLAPEEWTVHRVSIAFNNVCSEQGVQLDLFSDIRQEDKEKKLMRAVIAIQDRYGKNSIFLGMDLLKDARTLERNREIGGHRA